jgi:hypothetical protein
MADSTCHFKREKNPKPILPPCRYNLNCTKYTREHRFGFYHDTFDSHHRERMKFLLTASKYSLSKKQDAKKNEEPAFSGRYLWEQFSVDLNDEQYHDFLIYTYMYIMHLEKPDYADLMSIKQAFTTLEENGITGIYYLNVAFMMWVFKFTTLQKLQEFLDTKIGVIAAKYDIHFNRLVLLIRSVSQKQLNSEIIKLLASLESSIETQLKIIYSEFMLSNTYKTSGEQTGVLAVEKQIIEFQQSMFPDRDSYTISNSQLGFIIQKMIPQSEQMITGQLF